MSDIGHGPPDDSIKDDFTHTHIYTWVIIYTKTKNR